MRSHRLWAAAWRSRAGSRLAQHRRLAEMVPGLLAEHRRLLLMRERSQSVVELVGVPRGSRNPGGRDAGGIGRGRLQQSLDGEGTVCRRRCRRWQRLRFAG